MATAMNRRNTKKVKALNNDALAQLIKALQGAIPESISLLECAQQESKRRHKKRVDQESLHQKWLLKGNPDGDQSN